MAKHKAPTQVTIAPTAEKSGFEEAVHRYWKPAVLVALAIGAGIVFIQVGRHRDRSAEDAQWDDLRSVVDVSSLDIGVELPDPEDVAPVADQLEGTDAGFWARAIEAKSLAQAGRYEPARKALEGLQISQADHPVVQAAFRFEEEGDGESLFTHLEEVLRESQGVEDLPREDPPPLPEDAPRVRLVTDRGPIVVGLYAERAPNHVGNFLELCREGYYDGTLFHRVLRGMLIQGGDPNTRDGAPSTWGQGGPDKTLPLEISDAWHYEGMLAAAKKPGSLASSGSQFYLTAQPTHQFDKAYTVFGRVLEGMDLVKEAAKDVPAGSETPENPLKIESTEVL